MVRDWTKDYFHEKYECYCDMVYRICMLYLKNESDARDGLQDIFLKMWEKQPVFENASHEKAWLIRVAINVCKDFQKSFWQKKTVGLDETAELTVGVIEDAVRLIDVFELSPKNRTVLQLYYYEGYSVTEISKILKISVNGVTSRLSRARSKLKLEMEAAENEKSGIIPEH